MLYFKKRRHSLAEVKYPRIGFSKKLLFSLIVVVFFLCLSEFFLFLSGIQPVIKTEDPFIGFESTFPLFEKARLPNGKAILRTAGNKLPFFNFQSFPQKKGRNTYRIFCLGGSVTYGRPYNDLTSFVGWLREFLRAVEPTRAWEVINAGGISYASYRIALLMEELVQYQPDLFIVYSGHNEFLEERTYREIINLSPFLAYPILIFTHTRVYTLLTHLFRALVKTPSLHPKERAQLKSEVDTILEHTIGPASYTRDEKLAQQILTHFCFSLERMVRIARSAGSEIIFIVPAANLKDCSPFKSEHKANLSELDKKKWLSFYHQGKMLEKEGRFYEALKNYQKARELDPYFAELRYRIGKILFSLEQFEEAKVEFEIALAEDICPLRATRVIREAVRKVAKENGVSMVDFENLLIKHSLEKLGHTILGKEYFFDHVHPKIASNRLLALSLLEKLATKGIVKKSPPWNKKTLESVIRKVESQIDKRAHAEALHNLAKVLSWAGKYQEAIPLARKGLQTISDHFESLLLVGTAYENEGKYEEALKYYLKALQVNPDHRETYDFLGGLLVKKGELRKAWFYYHQALRLEPKNSKLHYKIGVVLARLGNYREAITHLRQAIDLAPNEPDFYYNLGVILTKIGNLKEAAQNYTRLLEITPDDVEARNNLGLILLQQRQFEKALFHYREALRVNPSHPLVHFNLGVTLYQMGKIEEAEKHFSKAIKLQPELEKVKFETLRKFQK